MDTTRPGRLHARALVVVFLPALLIQTLATPPHRSLRRSVSTHAPRGLTGESLPNERLLSTDDKSVATSSGGRIGGFTGAKLRSFDATRNEDGRVLVRWRTGFEVDNLGFNLYRERGGKRTRVNPELIAGSALRVGQGTALRSGYSYSWADEAMDGGCEYWLEAVDLDGRSEMFGPIATRSAKAGDERPCESDRAFLLSAVGAADSRANLSKPVMRTAGAASSRAAVAWGDTSKPAVKLMVDREGWYRVTAQELKSAGLSPSTDPRRLQLFAEGREQSIIVRGESDGLLDSTDSMEFYGLGLDTPSTNTRTYWLVEGEQAGLRIKTAKAKGSKTSPTGFAHTIERRERTVYFSSLKNGERENFFGAVVARNPVSQSLSAVHIDQRSPEEAVLEVTLQGVTQVDHRVTVRFNETELGELVFRSTENRTARFAAPSGSLREGENIVTLVSHQADGDVSLVDSIRLTYPHTFTADDDALRFAASGKRNLTIDGFTSPAIRVVDVTDPAAPSELKTKVEHRQTGNAVTIKTPKGGERLLMAFTEDQIKRPVRLVAERPSTLRDRSREADLVIVTKSDLIGSVEPLVLLRKGQGLRVVVVDVEDIYDEFNFGEKSTDAIKDFFAFARSGWSVPPRFALIVGDASFDPKNYLAPGEFDIVPTKMVDTSVMETSSDEWLVDFDGDGAGELAIGRLPARTVEEAALMIDKIVASETAPQPVGVLLISDSNDGIDFESGTGRLGELVPEDIGVEQIVRGRRADSATRSQVLDGLSRGKRIVSYFGHGSVDVWRGGILTSADVAVMPDDGGVALFLSITCLNGYFQDPSLDGLAESLVRTRGGAAAVWASSGMCGADEQLAMNLEMFRLLFSRETNDGPLTLGEAVLKAKTATVDGDVRQTYILFGDPSARIR